MLSCQIGENTAANSENPNSPDRVDAVLIPMDRPLIQQRMSSSGVGDGEYHSNNTILDVHRLLKSLDATVIPTPPCIWMFRCCMAAIVWTALQDQRDRRVRGPSGS